LVPRFIGRDLAIRIFEIGFNLRVLCQCQANHPLCGIFSSSKGIEVGLELKWLLSWSEIHERNDKLNEYMDQVLANLEASIPSQRKTSYSQGVLREAPYFGLFDTQNAAEEMLSYRIQEMSRLPDASLDPFVSDFNSLHEKLKTSSISPLSLVVQNSLSHALDIQSKLIQHALISLLFSSFDLRHHFLMLHSSFLFGNGIFITRLQEALFEDFDQDDVRAGGQTGLGLGIGLITEKNTWPPNAARVSLVLRNVLSESGLDLPYLNFAYHELSEEELQKVKNPIGIPFKKGLY
jgi:hypothetical protein